MTELLTSAQMREIEQAAMASGRVTGLELMERAGRAVVDSVLAAWPGLAAGPGHAVVLCGPGNNGGDGYVVARRLKDRGWDVTCLALGDPARLPPDARANREIYEKMGEVRPLDESALAAGPRPDLMVDALFGTGLSRPIPEIAARALAAIPARPPAPGRDDRPCRRLAVDCPSGLDCDSGRMLLPEGLADAGRLGADLTVTFHKAKVGHYLGRPPMPAGRVMVADIGLGPWDKPEPQPWEPPAPGRTRLVGPEANGTPVQPADWPGRLLTVVRPGAHKYERGHALILGGGPGRGGAARMAARAALRAGAGLVTLAPPPEALAENAAQLDAIMLRPVADADALARVLEDRRFTALCLGPGLGVGERTRALVAIATGEGRDGPERRRVVLDADALTSFAESPETLFDLLHPGCVLTPHEGEFGRLFPDLALARRDGMSKLQAAREAADRAGATILLKGPDTVIASPRGHAAIHAALYERAAPWLATAGAGDVLAGIATALLAPVWATGTPQPRVELAAWLHVEAARRFGPGLTAEDLPGALAGLFADLGL